MKTKTKKTRIVALQTEEQFRATCDDVARLEVEWRELTAVMDAEIQAVRLKYEPELTLMQERNDYLGAQAMAYAEANREKLFPKGKTYKTSTAIVTFRLGQPTLATTKGNNWKLVVARMQADEEMAEYLTLKEPTPNKVSMLAHLTEEQLTKLGLTIKQQEAFAISAIDKTERGMA